MSDAHDTDVTRHFKDGRKPRLAIAMLPRDVNRVTGTLRRVLCNSFNYTKRYPVKLEKFIEILRYATNFAMAYQHFELEAKKAKQAEEEEKEAEQLAAEERLAKQKAEEVNNA